MIAMWHLTWLVPAVFCFGAIFGVVIFAIVQAVGKSGRKEEKRK